MRTAFYVQAMMMAVVSLGSVLSIECQNLPVANVVAPKRLTTLVNKSGWTIPDSKQFLSTESIIVGGKKIDTKYFLPQNETQAELSSYFLDGDNLLVRNQTLLLHDFTTYSFENRLFAFQVRYVPFAVSHGVKRIQGAVIIRYYFDNDGDGLFETMYDALQMKIEMPSWVMKK